MQLCKTNKCKICRKADRLCKSKCHCTKSCKNKKWKFIMIKNLMKLWMINIINNLFVFVVHIARKCLRCLVFHIARNINYTCIIIHYLYFQDVLNKKIVNILRYTVTGIIWNFRYLFYGVSNLKYLWYNIII